MDFQQHQATSGEAGDGRLVTQEPETAIVYMGDELIEKFSLEVIN